MAVVRTIDHIAVTVSDFTGDGLKDLLIANQDNSVSILPNTLGAPGTFQAARTFAAHLHPTAVAVGNFNKIRDLQPDLAVTNFDSQDVSVLLGNTGRTLEAPSGNNILFVVKNRPAAAPR